MRDKALNLTGIRDQEQGFRIKDQASKIKDQASKMKAGGRTWRLERQDPEDQGSKIMDLTNEHPRKIWT